MAKKQVKAPPTPKKLVRFDWFIKNLLRNKADFEILEGFLCELLKDDIKILKVLDILESEGGKKDQLDKFNRVDVLVKTSTDERIIIEVQNTKELDYLQRILYGTSKVIAENITEGQS
jgi:predicted transposase/invertase (TIGR01784 family)